MRGKVDAEDVERVLKISGHTSSFCSEFGIVDNRLIHICDEIVRNEDRDGRAYLPVTVMADVLVKAGYTCSREEAVKAYLEAVNRRCGTERKTLLRFIRDNHSGNFRAASYITERRFRFDKENSNEQNN